MSLAQPLDCFRAVAEQEFEAAEVV